MKEIKHFGRIEHGRLVYSDEQVFRHAIFEIRNANHVEINIRYGNKRSADQNAYLFGGVCTPIKYRLHQEGWVEFDEYDVYKWLENKFCKKEYSNKKTGEVFNSVKPFKKHDTKEFSDRVEEIRQWASESLGIYIKTPAEHYGLSEQAYDLWKEGIANFAEAKRLSEEPELV